MAVDLLKYEKVDYNSDFKQGDILINELDGHKTIVVFCSYSPTVRQFIGIQIYSSNEGNIDFQLKQTSGWIKDEFEKIKGDITLKFSNI